MPTLTIHTEGHFPVRKSMGDLLSKHPWAISPQEIRGRSPLKTFMGDPLKLSVGDLPSKIHGRSRLKNPWAISSQKIRGRSPLKKSVGDLPSKNPWAISPQRIRGRSPLKKSVGDLPSKNPWAISPQNIHGRSPLKTSEGDLPSQHLWAISPENVRGWSPLKKSVGDLLSKHPWAISTQKIRGRSPLKKSVGDLLSRNLWAISPQKISGRSPLRKSVGDLPFLFKCSTQRSPIFSRKRRSFASAPWIVHPLMWLFMGDVSPWNFQPRDRPFSAENGRSSASQDLCGRSGSINHHGMTSPTKALWNKRSPIFSWKWAISGLKFSRTDIAHEQPHEGVDNSRGWGERSPTFSWKWAIFGLKIWKGKGDRPRIFEGRSPRDFLRGDRPRIFWGEIAHGFLEGRSPTEFLRGDRPWIFWGEIFLEGRAPTDFLERRSPVDFLRGECPSLCIVKVGICRGQVVLCHFFVFTSQPGSQFQSKTKTKTKTLFQSTLNQKTYSDRIKTTIPTKRLDQIFWPNAQTKVRPPSVQIHQDPKFRPNSNQHWDQYLDQHLGTKQKITQNQLWDHFCLNKLSPLPDQLQ